ncbi:MAG: hypothetical protein JXO51_05055, partial [Candidatus Aminicenantes bacterium]|nr:hypothetical protein [Candidatus Aminicenantes bacterium]
MRRDAEVHGAGSRFLVTWAWIGASLLLLQSLPAQVPTLTIPAERITSDSGMAAEWVLSMAQDRRGFMWFGTNLGLARHDGIHYKVYRRANTLPHPLGSDYIFSIVEDESGDLWLATNKGLNRLHAASETFSVFRHDTQDPDSLTGDAIFSLVKSGLKPDSLWVATAGNGLGLFNTRTGKCRSFRADPSRPGSLASDSVRWVYEDSRRQVWVATGQGFHRFRPDSGDFDVFRHDPRNPNTIGNDNVFEIFESKSEPGILWVGTAGNGLYRFDSDRRAWQRYLLPPAELPDPYSNAVYYVSDCPNEPSQLLIGTRQGLFMFDKYRHTWRRIVLQDQFRDTGERRNELVLGIFQERSGVCWVSIANKGLYKFLLQPSYFRTHVNNEAGHDPARRNNIGSLTETDDGRLWLGTAAGLFRYDPPSGVYEYFPLAPASPKHEAFNVVSRLCQTRGGSLWAATGAGLVRFDPRSGEQEVFPVRQGDADTLGFTRVASLCEDSRGDLWIGSDDCLLRWEARTRTFQRYLHDPEDPRSLSASHVNPILEDREGNVWIGTENGLNLYDSDRDAFTRYYLDPPDPSKETQNYIMILHQDARGRLWIATSNGLNLMERHAAGVRFEHFAAPGSTLYNFVLGVLEDDEDNLWISSPGGLSRFHMPSRTFSHYDSRDRVPPVYSTYQSCLRSRGGELFFGGDNGMFSFKPWLARFTRFVPPLAFTDIQIWRKPV